MKTTYELVNTYINEMGVSLADATINNYKSVLLDFARTCGKEQASKELLIKHIMALKDAGNSNNTLRTKITVIKGFTAWAVNNGNIESDFAECMKLPTPEYHIAERMTKDEVSTMLHERAPHGTHNVLRNKAIMELAIVTASRVSAICSLKREDIDFDRKTIRFRHTKRNKEIELSLTDSLCNSLTAYIEQERPEELTDSDYLFVGERRQHGEFAPLTRQQIYNISKAYTANACGKALSPHKLRHTSASIQIESGKLSIDEISANLGHASVATTQRYAQRLNDAPRRAATAAVFEGL